MTKIMTDGKPVTFPTLPHDGFPVAASDRISLSIDAESCNAVKESLIVAWASVLASYAGSNNVLFDVLSSSLAALKSCPMNLQPGEPVSTALNQVTSVLATASDEISRGATEALNLLVIQSKLDNVEHGFSYPLIVHCQVEEDAIQLEALFDGSIVDSEIIQLMLFQLRSSFQMIVSSSQIPLKQTQTCSPEGLQRIVQWNAETAPERSEALAHDLIEQTCRNQPSSQAVCAWDGSLTYEELNGQATRLATRLVAAGVGPDRFVGLLMEKSMWTTVAMLAVMKAGGCFFLLDASQPIQRLSSMCQKAQPIVFLASAIHAPIAEALKITTLLVPRDIPDTEVSLADLKTEVIQPHHILYAGFTSGSTGESKGFVMDQTAFSSGLEEYCKQSGLNSSSRVLQFASYGFIISLTDQIAPLTRGGCVCVPSEDQLQNDLAGAIRRLNANWAKLTPSVLRLLTPSDVSGLSKLIMVGEPMNRTELAPWQQTGVSLFSLYGLSENAKGGMFGPRNDPKCDVRHFARPFGATPWIVDQHDPNILLPIGAEGELLFEGPCVSRGYIDNDEQNRITFVQDPAWLTDIRSDGHGRFLKTGDLVRYNPQDGTLHLIGRKGTRVKIRGQRVELAEIEHHLRLQFQTKEPPVVELVVPCDEKVENPMLVAFVPTGANTDTAHGFFVPPSNDFRHIARTALSNLRDVLPSFMVPGAVVAIPALPRTPTGKLHRRMLGEEASKLSRKELLVYTSNEAIYQSPVSEIEIILQRVCAQVLDLPLSSVGMQANFFDLGANSITARHLVMAAREAGVCLTVADVFRQPSLFALAECHSESEMVMECGTMNPFESRRSEFLANLPAPWTPEQVVEVFPALEEQAAMASWNEVDYHLFELTGPVDQFRLRRACQTLADQHSILRSIFVPFEQTMLQIVLRYAPVPLTVHVLTDQDSAGDWAKSFCITDLQKTYQADQPVLEFILAQDAPEHYVLIMRLLHAQYDAVCLPKLTSDLWALYQGQEIHIPSDFSDFVRECHLQRTAEAYQFWRTLLANSHVTPAPFEEVSVTKEECVTFEKEITLPTTPKGITMATVIKAAWSKVLQEQTGRDDIVFGQFVNSRNILLPGVGDIIGPCFSIIPVRVQLEKNSPTSTHLLRTVQAQHADSISVESIGWKDVASTSTQWPAISPPGSVVMFQNFTRDSEKEISQVRCRKLTQFFKIPPLRTVYLIVYPSSTHALLTLEASNAVLPKDEAESVLNRLGVLIQEICTRLV
jgi:amino acid adenylation domain-containing protein